MQGRKLDAQHHITVDQLEFGAKTASKDAVSLPVKLAVALLKDRNGVIDLDIPVSGTLDDPTFRLGPIIWKVFVNILEKAVTAPFALLGSLFGGGPDLQFIDFRPGAADLDSAAADKGRAMVKALTERPQLKIEVPIAWVGDLDRPALVEARFMTQVRDAQAAGEAGGKKPAAAAPGFEQLDPAVKAELLTQLYIRNIGGEPKYPEAVTSIKTKARTRGGQSGLSQPGAARAYCDHRCRPHGVGATASHGHTAGVADGHPGGPCAGVSGRQWQGESPSGKVRLEMSLK